MKVLVVDDDEHILRAIGTSLRRAGYDVTTVDDVDPALALTTAFDVVLADFNMKSDATGADVVRHFKSLHGASTRCYVLSGEDDDQTRKQCFAAGAEDVLLKPVSPLELRRLLAAAATQARGEAA